MADVKIGSFQKQFRVGELVEWRITETVGGTGIIMGKGLEGIVDLYIVGLDKPIEGSNVLAILVPSTGLELRKGV